MSRYLTEADDESGGLGVKFKYYSAFIGSIDIKKAIKNLCASQKYHYMPPPKLLHITRRKILELPLIKSGWNQNVRKRFSCDMKT